ncbi:glycoside hydrolase [Massarina eburnea CBS 473.64]|uniref:Beta-mannosidase B n=1 Tax=Massarina eburnea CBS 473.64 TaxID=1395130 RepID=A0A6A6S0M0_9PLEO|nr:glycoside hydrolase [Massarina eburnea CBS 473.64]
MASVLYGSKTLTEGWIFKQGDRASTSEYLPANNLPTEVHLDLIKNDKISDPFDDINELSVRWVEDVPWTYRTTFQSDAGPPGPGFKVVLVFGGLDTFATVYLNGNQILKSENMFIEHRIDVTELVKNESEGENVLEIEFESARQKGLELVEAHKEHRFIVHQTEISRGPVRKAQYHWGWDWGPILLGCGPWKPIRLERYLSRIEDLWVEYEFSDDYERVTGTVFVKIEGSGSVQVTIEPPSPENGFMALKQLQHAEGHPEGTLSGKFELRDVQLWWPIGYGKQALYGVSASLTAVETHSVVQQLAKKIGFRKVELVQELDSDGTSFYFRINNVDIFSGGSCWIPADSFLSRTTPAEYRSWIQKVAEGNQVMIRVWGGGIYEADEFFDAADEFGIIIWQDFAFACASYPVYPSYLESVETEARQNVQRLRNHPSLVIWAGNNEDYQLIERYGLEYDYEGDKDPQSWLKTNFPARYIYEYLLPKIVKEETKGIPYHPSSPFGNGTSTVLKVDPTVGDIHQWNVWHGTMEPYHRLPNMGGRFVSEFGMEAYPHLETLEKCITNEEDRYPGSMAMDFRNKAIGHERRLVSYVAENFRIRYDLKGFAHLTQVMQADALSWAYKSWRRDWGTAGKRKCGGVLVWQLNDCWPTMSWAVVDYYQLPKAGYYAIKRALEPITINVQRKVHEWTVRPADALWNRDTSHIDMRKVWGEVEIDVWVASAKTTSFNGEIVLRYVSVNTGEEVLERSKYTVEILTNGTTDVIQKKKIEIPNQQGPNEAFSTTKSDPFVVHATLSVKGKHISSDISWPDPIKYLSFSDREVEVKYSDSGKRATVSAKRPVKGFVFSEKQGITLSDNGFDIVPGEAKEVIVTSENGKIEGIDWAYVEEP